MKTVSIIIHTRAMTDDRAGDEELRSLAVLMRTNAAVEVISESSEEGLAAAWNAGMEKAHSEWVLFCEATTDLPSGVVDRLETFLNAHENPEVVLLCTGSTTTVESIQQLNVLPVSNALCFFRRPALVASGIRFDGCVRSGFELGALAARFLLANNSRKIATISCTQGKPSTPLAAREPEASGWKDRSAYDAALIHGYLQPLQAAQAALGSIPNWLQDLIVNDLHWYFTIDLRERAPTVVVTESMAVVFHERVREIMSYIDPLTIARLDAKSVSCEVRHALFSYQNPQHHSAVSFDAYDYQQRLVRLTYFIHGTPPSEEFLLDNQRVDPAYSKYRSCRFFRRPLLRQRIVWLPVREQETIQVQLNGQAAELVLGEQAFVPCSGVAKANRQALAAVRQAFPPGKGKRQSLPSGFHGLKIRLVRWISRLPTIRKKYGNAWLFRDRSDEADDNAEHFYRWVRQHHPEINTWFLLDRSSCDWNRLKDEGFRLIPQGWLRKFIILNSDYIISSHADYTNAGLDPSYYGDLMTWKSVFIPHGISKDDVSHWLNALNMDFIASTSPSEYMSFISDNTPYRYTKKEVSLTGFPRQDKLLEIENDTPAEEKNVILIMPTWRGSLVDQRTSNLTPADLNKAIRTSTYISTWRSLLNNKNLASLATKFNVRIVFFPHQNATPLIDFFDTPENIEIRTKQETSFLPLLCRSLALVTDYTSVAFEMANLRRPTFYYHFDREKFYTGDHNWRTGYYDYDTDGFGPVAFDESRLVYNIEQFLLNHCRTDQAYLDRMESALPRIPGNASERVFNAVLEIGERKQT